MSEGVVGGGVSVDGSGGGSGVAAGEGGRIDSLARQLSLSLSLSPHTPNKTTIGSIENSLPNSQGDALEERAPLVVMPGTSNENALSNSFDGGIFEWGLPVKKGEASKQSLWVFLSFLFVCAQTGADAQGGND